MVIRLQHQLGSLAAEFGSQPPGGLHGFSRGKVRDTAEPLQISSVFPVVQQGSGGADPAEVISHRAQNRQRLLLHFQQLLQLLKSAAVLSRAQHIRHLKHHRVQHRLGDGVDVAFADFLRAGIGADFVNLPGQRRHGAPSDVDEIQAQVRGNPLSPGGKVPGDPGCQIPGILLGEFHNQSIVFNGSPELFQPLVRLPGGGFVGEYYGAVFRDIRKQLRHFAPVALSQPEQIHLVHLYQGVLRQHGQILHRVGKALQIEGLIVHAVEIEGLRQRVKELLFDLLQIVVQQEDFFPMENIQPPQLLAF